MMNFCTEAYISDSTTLSACDAVAGTQPPTACAQTPTAPKTSLQCLSSTLKVRKLSRTMDFETSKWCSKLTNPWNSFALSLLFFFFRRPSFWTKTFSDSSPFCTFGFASWYRCFLLSSIVDGQPSISWTVVGSDWWTAFSAHPTHRIRFTCTRKIANKTCLCIPWTPSQQTLEATAPLRTRRGMQR